MPGAKVQCKVDQADLRRIREKLDRKTFNRLLGEAHQLLGGEALRLMRGQTDRWNDPPSWSLETKASGFWIRTEDPRYDWVDRGTKAHIIRARNAKALHWINGGSFFAKWVRHPGTKAQHLGKKVLDQVRPRIPEVVYRIFRQYW